MNESVRNINEFDFEKISFKLNDWWEGRNMSDMLPRLFFKFFKNTSYVFKNDDEIVGFLIGFISQSNKKLGYVHFIGVNPNFRNKNIGRKLYTVFFEKMKQCKVEEIQCVTSIVNKKSIQFHRKIGFDIMEGDAVKDDISYFNDYDGKGEDRVLFSKTLNK